MEVHVPGVLGAPEHEISLPKVSGGVDRPTG